MHLEYYVITSLSILLLTKIETLLMCFNYENYKSAQGNHLMFMNMKPSVQNINQNILIFKKFLEN